MAWKDDVAEDMSRYEVTPERPRAPRHRRRWWLVAVLAAAVAAGVAFVVWRSCVKQTLDRIGDTELHLAAWANDAELAEVLLDAGADIDAKNDLGMTPLVLAVRSGSGKTAGLLLAHEASVDGLDRTVLRSGLRKGGDELRHVLLEHGVAAGKWGTEDLCRALSDGHAAFGLFLIEQGVALTGSEYGRHSPLHSAALHPANAAVVRVLLSKGQDVNGDDHERPGYSSWHSGTPLALAVLNENWDIAKILLEAGADASSQRHGQKDLLAHAAHGNREDVVKLVIARGAAVNVVTWDSSKDYRGTPLLLALRNKNYEIAEVLIRAGADPVVKGDYANETYRLLADSGRVELVKLVMAQRKPPQPFYGGHVFLESAIRRGDVETAKLVIERSCKASDIEEYRREDDVVALAIHNDRRKIAGMLIDRDWRFTKLAIELAMKKDWDDLAEAMVEKAETHCTYWKDPYDLVDYACKHGKVKLAECLLKDYPGTPYVSGTVKWAAAAAERDVIKLLMKYADSRTRDGDAPWLLAQSAAKGQVKVVEVLCEGGVNVNWHTKYRMPPLWYAVQSKSVQTVKVLIKHKADLKLVKGELTVVSLAAHYSTFECAKALVEAGCPVRGFDGNTWTPLHAAASTQNFELAKLLIAKGADVNAVYRKKWTPMDAASGRRPTYYEGWLTPIVRTPRPPAKAKLSRNARRRESRKKVREMMELLSGHGGKMYLDLEGEQNLAPGP